MSFMKEVVERGEKIWDECYAHPFITELGKGTLPEEKFKNYIVQDSIYIKEYARIYAMAMYKAETLREIQMYYSVLGFVTEKESETRLKMLARFGMDDDDVAKIAPLSENKAYTDFMFYQAETGDMPEILMALMPCMLSYYYVFKKLADNVPGIEGTKYWELIRDYSSDGYGQCCREWTEYTSKKCEGLDEKRKQKLMDIFLTSSRHERSFWEMSYREEK